MERTHYLQLQSRGVLALPIEFRRRHGLDAPGAHIELIERENGVIELRPRISVPADQAWFWTERWQQMEREVDEDIAAGRERIHETSEDFIAFLEQLVEDG